MNNKLMQGLALAAALASATGAGHAQAATATGAIAVSATVLAVCTVAALPLSFGNYSSVQLDAQTTISVLCTPGTTYNVQLDAGLFAGATVTTRKMALLGASLGYSIYRDSGRTQNWGQTIGSDTVSGSGNGLLQTINAYGRIPAAQYPGLGIYLDTVGVTVAY